MQSWRILRHSINMVLNNFSVAVRVAVPLVASMVLSLLIFGPRVFMSQVGADILNPQPLDAQFEIKVLSGSLIQGIGALWTAVAWHRYILLEETPTGLLPPFNGSRILSYFGHGLLLTVVGLAVLFLVGSVGALILATGAPVMVFIGGVIVLIGVLTVFVILTRLYVVLPAAAVGQSIKFAAAWEATKGYTGAIIGAYILFILLAICAGLVFSLAGMSLGFIGALLMTALNLALSIIGVSFLTTIYGVTIEGRELT